MFYLKYTKLSNCTQGSNEIAWYTSDKTYISRSFGTPVVSPSNASYVRIEYMDNINAQVEEGYVATEYEPYIPSVKMLAEEVSTQNESLGDLAYGEFAGGKNLLNPSVLTYTEVTKIKFNAPPKLVAGKHYMISAYNKKDGTEVSAANLEFRWLDANDKMIYSSNTSTFKNGFDATESMVNASYVTLYSNMIGTFYVQLEEGTTATEYEPYIPSVKMLADEVSAQNESLEDYGLDNVFDGMWRNGRYDNDTGEYVYEISPNYIACVSPIVIGSNQSITFSADYVAESGIRAYFYKSDGTYLSTSAGSMTSGKCVITTPANCGKVTFITSRSDGITLANVGGFRVYVNNEIDKLKNDLDKLNSLPIGSIIQIEAAKDNIETTEQKYGWQYLGTSNIECNDGSVKLLVTNVYRKNN